MAKLAARHPADAPGATAGDASPAPVAPASGPLHALDPLIAALARAVDRSAPLDPSLGRKG